MPPQSGSQTFRRRLIFLTCGLLACLALLITLMFSVVVPYILRDTEERFLNKQLELTVGMITQAEERLCSVAGEVAIREEAAGFIDGSFPEYFEKNWESQSLLQRNNINFIFVKDAGGRLLYSQGYDYFLEVGITPPDGLSERLAPYDKNTVTKYSSALTEAEYRTNGILFFEDVAYYVCSMPVLHKAGDETARGTITLCLILDDRFYTQLTNSPELSFSLSQSDGFLENGSTIERHGSDKISIQHFMSDIDGNFIRLYITDSRDAYVAARDTSLLVGVLLLGVLALFVFMFYSVYLNSILSPFEKLNVSLESDISETERKRAQQELIASMAQGFIAADSKDAMIDKSLMMCGEFLKVSGVVLCRLEEDSLIVEQRWGTSVDSATPRQSEFYSYIPFRTIIESGPGECVSVCDTEKGNRWKPYASAGIKSLLAVPIYDGSALWGVLGFWDYNSSRDWDPVEAKLVQLVGSLISTVRTKQTIEDDLLRMSTIVDSAPNFISYLNPDFSYAFVNDAATSLTGYSREELMQGGMELLYGTENAGRIREEFFPLIRREGSRIIELPLTRKDGERRIFTFSCFAMKDGNLGIGFIAEDVTEKLRLEQDLKAAKEQAEQSSHAKSSFLARMSHEMRTPMNAIIGMTNIAQGSDDPERRDHCLEKISEASTHLLGVINDVLDMSKIEAGKMELSIEEFDFEKMLRRVTNVINYRVDQKGQSLLVRIGRNVPASVIGDDQHLAQILTNLLSNSVKFTPDDGSITLSVTNEEIDGDYCTLRFEVRDTGIGMSEEQQSKLFQQFEQADGGIARKYGGTGLGLSISKTLIEMMGGEVWIDSELGKGSCVGFRVRLKKGSSSFGADIGTDISWDKLHVLIVDDDLTVLEYFKDVADALGFSCDTAAGAEEAYELVSRNVRGGGSAYSILFIDWKMPVMDGVELTRRIRRLESFSPAVIMISAYEWEQIETDARAAGVDGFLSKPLFSSLIVDCINDILGSGETRALTAQSPEKEPEGKLSGYTLLLAEDVEINTEIVCAILEPTGVRIDKAANGALAFEMFSANPERYSLILMDIHMPEMDGFEATRRIRALDIPAASAIPIVAMTANVFREDIEKCLDCGMNDHLGKPVDSEELLNKTHRYILK